VRSPFVGRAPRPGLTLMRPLLAFVLLASSLVAWARPAEEANPALTAVRALSAKGVSGAATAATGPTKFTYSGQRLLLNDFVKNLFDDAETQQVVREALVQFLNDYDKEAATRGRAHDVAGAAADSLSLFVTIVSGKEIPDEQVTKATGQLRKALDTPEMRSATDRQKQEASETLLLQAGLAVVLATGANDENQDSIVNAVNEMTKALIGVEASKLSFNADGIRIPATAGAAPAQPTAPAAAGLAPGFVYAAPADFKKNGAWYIKSTVENRSSAEYTNCLIRFPNAIPAQGNMGDALRKLWETEVPAELKERYGPLVYRRYTGQKLLTQFIFGSGKENGRRTDTVFTIFLVDCGRYWQPVVMAQTYEDTGSFLAGESMSASFSFNDSVMYAEPFLASFRCPGQERASLVDKAAMVGDYHFGSGASASWINTYTGSSFMTAVSYGGDLFLKADGTYSYRFASASGVVGAQTFGSENAKGRWSVEGDLLTLTPTSGTVTSVRQYRVAGVTQFADGNKSLVLLELRDPPIPQKVSDGSNVYTTKKAD
jgi:hypothetical protein